MSIMSDMVPLAAHLRAVLGHRMLSVDVLHPLCSGWRFRNVVEEDPVEEETRI